MVYYSDTQYYGTGYLNNKPTSKQIPMICIPNKFATQIPTDGNLGVYEQDL